jgi:CheY-specific phosphatase CheX
MSSHRSPVQAPADASALLRQALFDVCEQSFFAYVEACSPERFSELVGEISPEHADLAARGGSRAKPSEWLKASVAFTGPFGGAIEVVMPERLARSLVGSLLGEPPEAPMAEHQIFDGIGEFANMVCGAWLTGFSDRQAFGLRPPAVTRMAPGWTPLSESSAMDERGHRVCVNDTPVRVRLRHLD